jgi:hypothetical protein
MDEKQLAAGLDLKFAMARIIGSSAHSDRMSG